jgi:hypothetical protein
MIPFLQEPIPRVVSSLAEPWMLTLVVGVWVLAAVANVADRRWIAASFEATVSPRVFRELTREEGRVLTGIPLLLLVVAMVCQGLVVYSAEQEFGSGNFKYWQIQLLVLLVFGMKQLTLTAVDQMSGGMGGLTFVRFDHSLSHQVLGLLLLPVSVFVLYAQPQTARIMLVIAMALMLVAYIGRLSRGVSLAFRARTPLFYIIFYLCALEFLPLAVLVRLAMA